MPAHEGGRGPVDGGEEGRKVVSVDPAGGAVHQEGAAVRLEAGVADVRLGAELAVLSLLYSNRVLVTNKAQDTMYAAHQNFVSIDNFLTSPIGKKPQLDRHKADTIAKVLAHPLTEAEHRRQERDLLELELPSPGPKMIPDAVDKLRKRAEIEANEFLPNIDGPSV